MQKIYYLKAKKLLVVHSTCNWEIIALRSPWGKSIHLMSKNVREWLNVVILSELAVHAKEDDNKILIYL